MGTISGKMTAGLWMVLLLTVISVEPSVAEAALNQPLTVKNENNFSYSLMPVTGGVPLSGDLGITSPDQLNIKDSQGNTIPSQFRVTARWGGAPEETDKPIKWLLVTFFADIGSESSSIYYLTDGEENQTSSGLTIASNTADEMVIDTGAAEFTIDKQNFSLLKKVKVNDLTVTDSAENGFTLNDPAGVQYASFYGPPDSIAITESGPLRIVVKVTGTLKSSGGAEALDYTSYIYFYAGKSYLRVLYTLGNHRPLIYNTDAGKYDAFDYYGGNSVTFEDAGVVIHLTAAGGGLAASYPGGDDTESRPVTDTFLAYQDSSGTDYWDNYDSSDNPRPNSYCRFRGYRVSSGGIEIGAGDQFTGWMDLSGGDRGITAGIRDFRELFPKALGAESDGTLSLQLFPREYNGQYNFRVGEEKTHEFFLYFHPDDAAASNAAEIAAGLNHPLLAMSSPDWFINSGALPEFAVETRSAEERYGQAATLDENGLYAYFNDRTLAPDPLYSGPYSSSHPYHSFWTGTTDEPGSRDYFNYFGWSWYGNQPLDYEPFGEGKAGPFDVKYDFDYGAWLQFLRTRDYRWEEMASSSSRYLELIMLHDVDIDSGETDWAWKDAVFGHAEHGESGNQNGPRNYLGPVMDTAWGSRGGLLHYYLTGHPVSQRFVEKLAHHIYMEYHGEEGSTPRYESTPDLMHYEREYANVLTALVEGFRLTGDMRYQELIEAIIEHFAPAHQPWINGPVFGAEDAISSWSISMYLAPIGRYADLAEEYGLTDAARTARETLVAFTDWILTYAARDYQGEYSIYYGWNRNGENNSNSTDMINNWMLLMADDCAYAYKFTGDRAYMVNGEEFFRTGVHDPAYRGDNPTYFELKEAANQAVLGQVYMYYAGTLDGLPAESEAPVISLTEPAEGETVSRIMALGVNVSDNIGVKRVVYELKGGIYNDYYKFAGSYIAPFSTAANSLTFADGDYTLVARAYDFLGNSTVSAPRTITIANDHTPPVVTLTSPEEGENVFDPLALEATASDDVALNRVEFYFDHRLVSTVETPPYRAAADISSFPAGDYQVYARAVDSSGNITESDPVTVTLVDNAPPTVVMGISPDPIQRGEVITFSAAGTRDPEDDPLTYNWEFGDGAAVGGAVATHTYGIEGDITVTLTVHDPYRGVTRQMERTIYPPGELETYEIPVSRDTFIYSGGGNYGGDDILHVYNGMQPSYRTLLQFDLSSLEPSPAALFVSAGMKLYVSFTENSSVNRVYRITREWEEGTGFGDGATWTTYDGSHSWEAEGGDFATDGGPIDELTPAGEGFITFDLSSVVSDWLSGAFSNYGVLLTSPATQTYVWTTYLAHESAAADRRPLLTVKYILPSGEPSPPPTASPTPTPLHPVTPTPSATPTPRYPVTPTPRYPITPTPRYPVTPTPSAGTADQPSNLTVIYRSGQSFITWNELTDLSGERYRIYRSREPIGADNISEATLLYEVAEGTARFYENQYLENGIWKYRYLERYVIEDGGAELAEGVGLLVWTLAGEDFGGEDSGSGYYAVTTVDPAGGENISDFGSGNTFGPITEAVDDPLPVEANVDVGPGGHLLIQYMNLRDWNPTFHAPNPDNGYYGLNPDDPEVKYAIQYAYDYLVYEPTADVCGGTVPEELPVLLLLHGWSGNSYPPQSASPAHWYCSYLIYPVDESETWFFGFARDFDYRQGGDPASGVIVNYTEQRVLRMVYDLLRHPPGPAPDEQRVYIFGGSMGGSGTLAMALRYPNVFAAGYAGQGMTNYRASGDGGGMDWRPDVIPKWGPIDLNLPVLIDGPAGWADHLQSSNGTGVWDWQNIQLQVGSRPGEDAVPFGETHGRQDTVIEWPTQGYPFYSPMDGSRRCWGGIVNEADHGWQNFPGCPPTLAMDDALTPFAGLRVIRDETVPGLSNASDNAPLPPDEDGSYNGTIDWSASWNGWDGVPVDTAGEWRMSLRTIDGSAQQVDVTPRRLQVFQVRSGLSYSWENRKVTDDSLIAGGTISADGDGLITIRGFAVNGDGNRLLIRPADPSDPTPAATPTPSITPTPTATPTPRPTAAPIPTTTPTPRYTPTPIPILTPTPIPAPTVPRLSVDWDDYDGDGTGDLAVYDPASGEWSIENITSGLVWGGGEGDIPAPGDYNGDGTAELAYFDRYNGEWNIMKTGGELITTGVRWGAWGDVPAPGDYDGDGSCDFATWRPSDGRWRIRGITNIWYGQAAGMYPVPGDYNGDGTTDIAMIYPGDAGGTNIWYVNDVRNRTWMIDDGIAIPLDYDGDGTTDLGIYRPADGWWYIRQLDGPAMYFKHWGIPGDIPVVGDLDGDGRADLTAFRNQNGQAWWWILYSSRPYSYSNFSAQTTDSIVVGATGY